MKNNIWKLLILFSILLIILGLKESFNKKEETKEEEVIETEIVQQPKEVSPKEEEIEVVNELVSYSDVPLSDQTQIYMQEECENRVISYEFALAILESESSYRADAIGDNGRSVGYFQINKANWERMYEMGMDVHDPRGNIAAGVFILEELYEINPDPYYVIICYKAGETKGRKLYEAGKYVTDDYDCAAICERAKELEEGHGK